LEDKYDKDTLEEVKKLLDELFSLIRKGKTPDNTRDKILSKADEILIIDPHNFKALQTKVHCLIAMKEFEKGLSLCNEILQIFPHFTVIYHAKAQILYSMGRKEEVKNVFLTMAQFMENPTYEIPGFILEKVKIILKITKPQSMMVHHQWIWHVLNSSTNEIDGLVFEYEGDTPNKTEKINFKAKDNFENYLDDFPQIDYPQKKIIHILLKESILPGKRGGPYFIDFDWESPKREENFGFDKGLKEFSFELQIPKNQDWVPQVLEINEYLEEIPVNTLVKHQNLGNYKIFFWSTNKPKAGIKYKIRW